MSELMRSAKRDSALRKLYIWADRFTEFGPSNSVGANVIEKIKDKLDEAYQKGFDEGVRARGAISSGNLHGRSAGGNLGGAKVSRVR